MKEKYDKITKIYRVNNPKRHKLAQKLFVWSCIYGFLLGLAALAMGIAALANQSWLFYLICSVGLALGAWSVLKLKVEYLLFRFR